MKDEIVYAEVCHLVDLGDCKEPPKYCQKDEPLPPGETQCVCCPQCCTCGG